MEKTRTDAEPREFTAEELQEIRDRDAGFDHETDVLPPAIADRHRLLYAFDETVKTFLAIRQSHDALVKEIDWMLSGAQAAPQASLCDIVALVRGIKLGKFHMCEQGYAHPVGQNCFGQCLGKTDEQSPADSKPQ